MTRRTLRILGLLGIFVCFLLAGIFMVLSGVLSVRVWQWVLLIGFVIYLAMILLLSHKQISRKSSRNSN